MIGRTKVMELTTNHCLVCLPLDLNFKNAHAVVGELSLKESLLLCLLEVYFSLKTSPKNRRSPGH